MPVSINGNTGVVTGSAVGGLPDGIVDTDMLAANAVTAAKRGAGAILQIVKGGTGDLFSTTSTSYIDATGMSVAITTTGSNKVYLICDYTLSNTEGYVLARLTRTTSSTTTVICAGNTAGSRDLGIHSFYHNNSYAGQYITEKHCAIELDSPGAGTHTYKMQMRVTEGTGYLNSNSTNSSDPDRTVDTRTSSKIIVMEVAA